MDRDVYVKLLEKLHDAEGIMGGQQDAIEALQEAVAGLQPAITIINSSVSGNTTVAGQSYTDIFTDLPAGKYLVVVNYVSSAQLIICKGAITPVSNVYGDVASGGCTIVDISEPTTIKMYVNTDDATEVTYYRTHIYAIKIG